MAQTQLVVWKEEYSVGVRDIDSQHQRILGILNRLHAAMQQGAGSRAVEDLSSDLLDYTRTHFAHEEQLMARANYPALPPHRKAHQKLTLKTASLSRSRQETQGDSSLDLLRFLKDWWTNHILRMDREYAPFLRQS